MKVIRGIFEFVFYSVVMMVVVVALIGATVWGMYWLVSKGIGVMA